LELDPSVVAVEGGAIRFEVDESSETGDGLARTVEVIGAIRLLDDGIQRIADHGTSQPIPRFRLGG